MVVIWTDIKNSHEPLFFKSILDKLECTKLITSRDFAEIIGLLEFFDMDHKVIGKRPEGNIFLRKLGFLVRTFSLIYHMREYDVSMSHNSIWCVWAGPSSE